MAASKNLPLTRNLTRILAVDLGLARVGLAISDEQKIIASPLENLLALPDIRGTANRLLDLIEQLKREKGYVIEEIVVGLPLKMDGSDSKTTTHAREFVTILQEKSAIPVILHDERLTTVQAERSLMEGHFTRKKRARFVDRVSAVLLLQSYLQLRSRT